MNKAYKLIFALTVFTTLFSCRKDDGNPNFIPARDRGEEVVSSTDIVERYLDTHFYNYEEFASPPADFDYKIKFDTIAGDNSGKIPLREQVESKPVQDRVDEDVTYKLYYLKAQQGGGDFSPTFGDVATITYEGTWINEEPFTTGDYTDLLDSSVIPINFDLPFVVNGLQDAVDEFNVAEEVIVNSDGTVTPVNPGIGAVFMQSGLAYYVNENGQGGDIPVYAQLIFAFNVLQGSVGDQDEDGIPTFMEDVNGNGLEGDDNTDGDMFANFLDPDDDGDLRPTSEEIEIDEDGNITFPDTDGDGVVDYLDSDS
jgi:hypothetical protein